MEQHKKEALQVQSVCILVCLALLAFQIYRHCTIPDHSIGFVVFVGLCTVGCIFYTAKVFFFRR